MPNPHYSYTCKATAGERVLERILLPIANYTLIIKRQNPSEVPNTFGTENERKYSVFGGHERKLYE
jgi:hypothetical protein